VPELPEIETLKQTLEPRILGARVERVRVIRRDVITRLGQMMSGSRARTLGKNGRVLRRERLERGRDTRATALLEGDTIVELRRHGKQLAIIGESGCVICFHLGMSGQVRLIEGDRDRLNLPRKLSKHVHCVWRLAPPLLAVGRQLSADMNHEPKRDARHGRLARANDSLAEFPLTPTLCLPGDSTTHREREFPRGQKPAANCQQPFFMLFRDPRRFGGIWTAPDFDTLFMHRWRELGPDALTITAQRLRNAVARSNRPIKAALLDQAVLAGVGNIYADEALFRAAIHPARQARSLAQEEITSLARALRSVLRSSIRGGGSTLRDYADANGKAGRFVARHAVYGRAGETCVQCGELLHSEVIAQRTTVFCESCQTRKVHI